MGELKRLAMSDAELAELRWTVRGKLLDELTERGVELTGDVAMTVDVMLDVLAAFDEKDRLHELSRAVNDWEWQELCSHAEHKFDEGER